MHFTNLLPRRLNDMRSSPSSLCLLVVLLLSACGDAPDASTRELHPAEAYGWEAWVEREQPRRPDHYDPYYHDDRGLPDMRLWRPEDFLPEEDLTATHADICELPREERREVWSMPQIPSNIGITLEEKRAYAERGYPEAQASMSWYCYRHTNDAVLEPGQLSLAEALAWSRRGAASGDPRAMYRHSDCLRFMSTDTQSGRADHALDNFWMDQTHYWLWRAATEGLHGEALLDLRPSFGLNHYSFPDRETNRLYNYKWSRIWELQAIFRQAPYYLGPRYMESASSVGEQRESLDEQQLQQAEAMVGEWLREHQHVWDAIYRRPAAPSGSQVTCPGEPEHPGSFDYEGLNRELAQYGLHIEPPGD